MSEPMQRESRRYARVRLMFGLFPLLAAGGFLAPGWVQILATAQGGAEVERRVVVDRVGPYGRRPLLVPRDFSPGTAPALLDLDRLFLGSRAAVGPGQAQIGGVTVFDRSSGDLIAFDDLGQVRPPVDFPDILMQEAGAALSGDEEPELVLPLCGTLYAGNCVRDDDFSGGFGIRTRPIPEPDTAALLAIGIAGLAWQGRRRALSSRPPRSRPAGLRPRANARR